MDIASETAAVRAASPVETTVSVTVHPNHQDVIDARQMVAFAVPFPRGALTDINNLVVKNRRGNEMRSHVRALATWRTLDGARATDGSVRSALIFVRMRFANGSPKTLTLSLDGPRQRNIRNPGEVSATWREVIDDDYPIALSEPMVYATMAPEWLADCELRSNTTALDSDASWAWFDEFFIGAAYTATNDVPDNTLPGQLVNVEASEPWLADRTLTLFGVYARTGDITWLRRAHRAAQFYRANLTDDGYFGLKYGDTKYVYNLSLFVDMMLTGDESQLSAIEQAAAPHTQWDPVYTLADNFWTERHQTYAFFAAQTAWEATGASAHADRVRAIAQASFDIADNPADPSWNRDGCMLHTMRSHEGVSVEAPICSPWMTAMFAEAMWRYYASSQDPDALAFLADQGDFIAAHGLYDGSSQNIRSMVPWYLVSSVHQFSDDGPWGDREHACDVANLVARGAWAHRELGQSYADLVDPIQALLVSCRNALDYWHRPGSVPLGYPEYRLAPSRKFNWWFGSTLDMQWILADLGVSP